MMVKPVKKRAIQEWKMTEAVEADHLQHVKVQEKLPEQMPKAVLNHHHHHHIERGARLPNSPLVPQSTGVVHPTHPFHLPPGVMIPPENLLTHHYVDPLYIRPQGGLSRRLSPGPPNVLIRPPPPDIPTHPGLPGRGAKRPQAPQDMAAVEAKTGGRKRRKPEVGTTELVMSPFLNGCVNGSVQINEKVPPIQPIILDFEVPLPPISPANSPKEDRGGGGQGRGGGGGGEGRRFQPDSGPQVVSPVHSPASMRDDPRNNTPPADPKHPKMGTEHPHHHKKNSLFKKPNIDHYKSSTQSGGNRCFICQNAIIPNPKDYPIMPSGMVVCTKCRKLAMSGSPVATGPPPKIQIPGRSSQSRSQPQQRIPRSPVAKSPAASLTVPRSPLPRSPMARSPAPSSPHPYSSPSSPANTLSAPNSPASTSGLSVPGSPRYSAPSSPRYSAGSPRNSAPSSPIGRSQGSPLPAGMASAGRSPTMNSSSLSQPPSPRPSDVSPGRRHSISGTHLDVNVRSGASKVSPTGGIPGSPRSGDSSTPLDNLQLPPGREGDDATIRALLQLGRMRAADGERRSADGRGGERGELRLPRSLADMDQAKLLELHHKLMYAGLPSRCSQGDDAVTAAAAALKTSKGHGVLPLSMSSLMPHNAQSILKQAYQGSRSQLMRSEGVVGTALPIAALNPTTEDTPLKISRVIRSAQDRDQRMLPSPNEAQSRLRESLEALSKSGSQCGNNKRPHNDSSSSKSDSKSKYLRKDGTSSSAPMEMYRGQYPIFQCHCTGSEVFFIKCPDCDFVCNSIFGMELHIAAQRHAENRVGPPRDVDCSGCEDQSGKESRADSEASHSSFETQSADTEAEGSNSGSPHRTSQEPTSTMYSPVPGTLPEAWREQTSSRIRTSTGVVDLGSTVPHVNIPRHLVQEGRPHGAPEYSPLDLSGKRQQESQHGGIRERSGSRERRGEANGPLDLSGYKHIQTSNSQFVSSQRLGSVGSMIEKSIASSIPSLALSQAAAHGGIPGITGMGIPPAVMLAGAPPVASSQQLPYPIPTMFAVQSSSVAGLYPLNSLSQTIPLLAPVKIPSGAASASAPPSPSYSRQVEASQQRRASYSLAPSVGRISKSASPTPTAPVSSSSPPEQPRPGSTLTVPQQAPPNGPAASSNKVLNYQGGTITIQPSLMPTVPGLQKTVTLESQFSHSSPATPQGGGAQSPSYHPYHQGAWSPHPGGHSPHHYGARSPIPRALSPYHGGAAGGARSPQTPMPSSPAPQLSSTVPPPPAPRIKNEPQSDEDQDRNPPPPPSPRENRPQDKSGKEATDTSDTREVTVSDKSAEKEKSVDGPAGQEKEKEKSPSKLQTPPPSFNSQPTPQIKIESET